MGNGSFVAPGPGTASNAGAKKKIKKNKNNLGIPSEKKVSLYLLIMTRDTPNDLRKKKITSDLKPLLFVCKKILHFWCPEKKNPVKSGAVPEPGAADEPLPMRALLLLKHLC